MKNKPYLRSILGGTDFRSLSLIEKIRYINAGLLCLCKRHVNLILRDKLNLTTQKTDKNEEVYIFRFRWSDQYSK